MNLGIFLSVGDSLENMRKSGQKDRFINLYLKPYSKNFEKVYVFSFGDKELTLPKNVILVPNKSSIHRYLYVFLLPLIHRNEIKDCDVIRGFGLTSSASALLLIKNSKGKRIPFIFNWAYDYIKFSRVEKKYFYIPIYFLLEKLALIKADKIFIATKAKMKTLNDQKFIYLPNGVDLNIFNARPIGKGPLFVGRFEKQKNLFFLIDAIAKLPKKYREITFIGQGSQEKQLKKYAAAQNVSLNILSPVKNAELPKLLSKFSIFTLTSLAEGSPKVLLEAMAIGLVPVVTDFSTAREIIDDGQNGYLTKYNNQIYASRLESLMGNNILLNKISQRAKQTITSSFNLETLLKKEIKSLKEAAQ